MNFFMNIWVYLWPENLISRVVVFTLIILFFLWTAGLLYSCVWLWFQKKEMKRCRDVQLLAQAMTPINADSDIKQSIKQSFQIYSDNCVRLKSNSVTFKHLNAIFNAGCIDGRLDISELLKVTNNNLFKGNNLLRALLNTFIIFGLLGTLFGLADSLSQLSPLLAGGEISLNEHLSEELTKLLSQLKSAFAPSIWGITFTLSGMILFAFYSHFICSPIKDLLERLTLTVWVPELFRTSSQKMHALSREQMEKSFDAVKKVADFAKEFENDAGNLNQSLKNSNEIFSSIGESTREINSFVDKFEKSVSTLSSFQGDLQKLYQQMQEDSKIFHSNVMESNKKSETIQKRVEEIVDKHYLEMQSILLSFKSYEDAYIKSREGIDTGIRNVLAEAAKAYSALGKNNDDLIRAVGDPLRNELTGKLDSLENTLIVQLQAIADRIGTFDAPIQQASNQIAGSLEAVVKRTETLTKELHNEILRQDERNREQLVHLQHFNEINLSLLSELKIRNSTPVIQPADNNKEAIPTLEKIARILEKIEKKGIPSGNGNNNQQLGRSWFRWLTKSKS